MGPRLLLLGPRQWLPDPCGGCPRRPLSRPRLLLLGPRQWLPIPCGGCPRRPQSRRRLLLLGPRQWLPVPCGGCPAGLCRVVASFFSYPGSGSPSPVEVAPPASVALSPPSS